MSQDDPDHWTSKIVDIHEAAGAAWLERLPVTLAGFARRWSLELLPPFENLSYNYVAPAVMADGTPVVVKACVPNHELRREIDALRWFNGRGIVRLLDADDEQGVMVLERLLPGTLLQEVGDERQVTEAAAAVMQSLWKPAPTVHTFATLSGWARGLQRLRGTFKGGTGPFPSALVARAERLFAELLADGEPMLIHGDLHPQNILKSRRASWLAIDPKGVVGVPLYDAATFACSLPDQGARRDVVTGL